MATLSPNQVQRVYQNGEADRIALYAVRNFSTADVVDLSADFTSVKAAQLFNVTGLKAGATTVGAATATLTGTGLTGMSNDGGWLLVWGVAA